MFTYETTIDIARPQREIYWETIANVGDKKAHAFVIHLVRDKVPVDISTGYTVQLLATRHDKNTRYLAGTIVENAATAELDYSCYEIAGELRCTMEISKDGYVISAARIFMLIGEKYGEGIVDPSHTIPTTAELLDEIQTMRNATTAANQAADAANEAAGRAPYIDEKTGTWFVWDNAKGAYADQGSTLVCSFQPLPHLADFLPCKSSIFHAIIYMSGRPP